PAEPPELVFLGRLNIPHNDDAICSFIRAAMGELVRRHPHIRLRIIGKDPSDALLGLVAQHAPNVVLEGFVENLDSVFARATVSLAPLRFGSGVKIKMLDALARGVPTLATTVSVEGVPVTPEGENGCFVEDDLTRWPDLIDEMIDPTHNTQLSKAAVEFFESVYGREVVSAQYDDIFGLGVPVTAAP
ncbi:MAG: glycosyltransferase family 4 protein, partial [Pseudonocardia sp.]|nr:glycosyltransferase family 4 protein [Pseudonocardia sp.]